MKFTEKNGLYLEDITEKDIWVSNLAGRLTNSPYDDPNNPKHVLVLWIEDEEIREKLRELGVRVNEREDKEHPEIKRYSATFKAYPKMRVNRITGKEEQTPKVMLRTTVKTVRLEAASFGLVDAAHLESIDIKFRLWQYDQRKPDRVAVIEEIWATVDEGAHEPDESYLEDKYGYSDGSGEEELPFE